MKYLKSIILAVVISFLCNDNASASEFIDPPKKFTSSKRKAIELSTPIPEEEATQALVKLKSDTPLPVDFQYGLFALTLFRNNDFQYCNDICTAVIEHVGDSPTWQIHAIYSCSLYKAGEYDDADEQLQLAVQYGSEIAQKELQAFYKTVKIKSRKAKRKKSEFRN